VSTHQYALLVSNVTTYTVNVCFKSKSLFVYVCAVDDMPVFAGLQQSGITVEQRFVALDPYFCQIRVSATC